jgi:hypothetical protein
VTHTDEARLKLPSDLAAIGAELGRAINVQHRRHAARRSTRRWAIVTLAAIAAGSGTALATELVVQRGSFVFANPCVARAVDAPRFPYASLQEMDQACGRPYPRPATPSRLPALPRVPGAPSVQRPTASRPALARRQRAGAQESAAPRDQPARRRTNAVTRATNRSASGRRPLRHAHAS